MNTPAKKPASPAHTPSSGTPAAPAAPSASGPTPAQAAAQSLPGKLVTPPPPLRPHVAPHPNFDRPMISVVGVGGAGGNAVNNMIARDLTGVQFLVCNTDAQALSQVRLGRDVAAGAEAGVRVWT